MGRVLEFWGVFFSVLYLRNWVVKSFEFDEIFRKNGTDVSFLESVSILESVYGMSAAALPSNAVMVGLTLVHGAAAKGAVCLDGTNITWLSLASWIWNRSKQLAHPVGITTLVEDGATVLDRVFIARRHIEGLQPILKDNFHLQGYLATGLKKIPVHNFKFNKTFKILYTSFCHLSLLRADFFNWNRVKIRYCDGGSFAGDAENKAAGLQLRGQRIWLAVIEDLMSKGMHNARQALLSGCSAGGLASTLHCDELRNLFPRNTKVKCLSDGGLFMDALDVSGGRALRNFFAGVVRLQGFRRNLPRSCTNHRDPTSCFFPQNLITTIKTPLFILNAAYDSWQVQESLAPPTADPHGNLHGC